MGKSADSLAARQQVYKQLAERFPKKSIEWARTASWDPVDKVSLDRFDTADRTSWAASSDPTKVAMEEQKWKDGAANPIIAVQVGSSPQLIIVDGHHRFLARERMHKGRVKAFVAHVPDHNGPWMETHLHQFGGVSG